jgi:multiple sugar transport system permease protein
MHGVVHARAEGDGMQLSTLGARLGRVRRLTLAQREALACALFIAPAVFGFVAFSAIPLAISGWLSLTDYALAGRPNYVGFANYRALLADDLFWQSVRVTAKYVGAVVPMWMVSSLMLALLMNQPLHGISVFRTIYYLPAVLSGVATSMLWSWLFNYRAGLLNAGLRMVGVDGPNWLGDEDWALPSLMLMSQWSIGWYLPIWLGGLQSIPTELYESASLDGAGWWAKLRHVTIPMLSPVILYHLIMNIIWATQLFTEPFVMTGGGPDFATLSYVLYMYNNAFSYLKMGHAAAMAWMLFLATLVLTAFVFRSTPMWVHYEAERKNR